MKHIADQYEMTLGRPFVVYDKVVVVPEPGDAFSKPLFGQVVGVVSRDQMNQPVESVLAIREDNTLTTYLVYPRQCTLRK